MTDTEIIKALECCSLEGACKACPFRNVYETNCGECIRLLQIHSYSLILRQQAEINHFVEANKMVVETDKTEDEILKKLLTQRVEFIPNSQDVEDIKRDAVKEFANKLKEQAFECDISFGLGSQRIREAVAVDDIDTLVNEMFGNHEQKGE